jgi:RimJ/RimL family protein N-acetyltransferase
MPEFSSDLGPRILETERLEMRPHRIDDFADCLAIWTDPGVIRFLGGRPFTQEEVWTRLLRHIGHWSAMGFGYWVLIEKATGQLIGELGFANFRRDMEPELVDPEIGWMLSSRVHGKGYATEAVRAALAWGDCYFKEPRTVCIINPENLRSLRVAEKCGYTDVLRTSYKGHPAILFAREHGTRCT